MLSIGTGLRHYEIVSFIGAGGMGEVYRARDSTLDRDVALKVLPATVAADPERLRRFVQEAKSAASINHPNVTTIYEIAQSGGVHFIAMEYVEGETLRQRIAKGPIEEDELHHIVIQIANGLEAAHDRHVIHRDLKSSNIMITSQKQVKLLDFGLAKRVQIPSSSDATRTFTGTEAGVIMGTVDYMSPEQALGLDMDRRSDIFSLGVVLYEAASRVLPFSGRTAMETINQIINAEPEPIRHLVPEISAGLERIISRCLKKTAESRYHTAGELKVDLAESSPASTHSGRAPGPTNLLIESTSFVGRELEVSKLDEIMKTTRLLTLVGIGGIGKTRLAARFGSSRLNRHPDGVWYVALDSVADPGLVPQAVALTLGVPQETGRSMMEALLAFLKIRHLLLILDNCEHLIPACAQLVETLLHACGNLQILATSRAPLAVPSEIVWRLAPLSTPNPAGPLALADLVRYDAVRLFKERASAAYSSFSVNSQNAAALAQVCYRLEGIPLAIELAAKRVNVLSLDEIRDKLDDRFRLLTKGGEAVSPRHRALRATLDWSYGLLAANEQTLLNRVSIFFGGWTLGAAEWVCAAGQVQADDVLDLLSELVDKSLVTGDQLPDGKKRFRLLETVGQYARERLLESGEIENVSRQHAAFFLTFADEAEPARWSPAHRQWMDRMASEQDNFRAVLRWLQRNETQTSQLENQPVVQARLMHAMGVFYENLGLYDQADGFIEGALALRRRWLGEEHLEVAASLGRLGAVRHLKGDIKSAESLLREALGLRRKLLGDEHADVTASMNELAITLNRWETPESTAESERLYREALRIRRKLFGDKSPEVAQNLNNLGVFLNANKRAFPEAEHVLREALEINRTLLGDQHQEVATSMNNLALVLRDTRQFEEAEELFRRSLEIDRITLGDTHPAAATCVNNLANLLQRKGDHTGAEALYKEAIRLKRLTFPEHHWEVATIQSLLGACLVAARRFNEAEPLLSESYPVIRRNFGETHNRTTVALQRIIDLYEKWGKPDQAASWLSQRGRD